MVGRVYSMIGFKYIGLGCLFGWAISVSAQMVPDAPLKNFRYPVFNNTGDGYKMWELRGVEGHYVSETESYVTGLDLKIFTGDASMRLESRLLSPEARIYLNERRAEGDSSIFFSSENFKIQGEDWVWEGIEKKMTVGRAVRVVFNGELNILK